MNVGKRPTEILGISRSPIEDLLLDTAILAEVIPESEKGGVPSLSEEIERKRRELISKALRRRRYIM